MTTQPEPPTAGDLSVALHALWDLSIDMLVVGNTRGYLTLVSPSWSALLGYSPEELVAEPYLSFVHPDDVDRTLLEAQALTEPGVSRIHFENRYRGKDGRYHWLDWHCHTSEDGEHIYSVVRDVTQAHVDTTEHEELVARLKERELMLSSVIANSQSAIYVKDLEGRYLVYNVRFADVFDLAERGATEGVGALEVLLGRDDSWLDPRLQPVWRANDLRAAQGAISIEEWSEHPVRGRLTYDSMKFPLLDSSGEVYATCGVSLETTERVRLIEQHRGAEELFRGAFEHSPIGKALVGTDGRLIRANGSLAKIAGRDADQLVGRQLCEVLTPEYADQVFALQSTADVEEVVRDEIEIECASGQRLWVAASSSAVYDGAGALLHYIAQVQDVTDRVRSDEAQKLSESHFRSLFTHAAVGVIEALPDGTIAAANPRVCELVGYRAEELVGQPAAFVAEPVDQEEQARQIATLADGASGYSSQRRFRCKDGSTLPVLVSVGVVRDDAGQVERLVVTVVDMTAQVTAEDALRVAHAEIAQRQAFTEAVLESVDTGVLACDADAQVVLRNVAQRRLMGLLADEDPSPEELGRRVRVTREDGSEFSPQKSPLLLALHGVDQGDALMRITTVDGGDEADVRVTARQIRDDTGTVLGAVAAFTDVTAERRIQAQLREGAAFHDAVLAATPDLIYVSDVHTNRNLWTSRSIFDLLGYTEQQIRDLGERLIETLIHPDDVPRVLGTYLAARELSDGEVLELRYRAHHADGTYRWLARRITPFVRDESGVVTQVLGVARDVTDIIEIEQRLSDAALHDPLTGLPNRTLMADRLRIALSRGSRSGQEVAVLFCDLDNFKRVNDTGGHAAGDVVLRTTAQRLVDALRSEDTVARVGGDEFAIILEPSRNDDEDDTSADVRSRAAEAADRLRETLREPIEIADGSYVVSVSIGITIASSGQDPDEIIRDADTAMYRAKANGRDRAEFFDGALRADAAERGRIEQVLRATLGNHVQSCSTRTPRPSGGRRRPAEAGMLGVAYQPIFDLATMDLVGVEALARLQDAHGESITPDQFIPVAEETGLIASLGRHVLDVACDDLARWRGAHAGCMNLEMAVNLSARQAGLVDLREQVEVALTRAGLPPHLLTLELTESVLLDAGRSTMKAITSLNDMGVRISIDDFGTGYASLRYLAELPVSKVKVDRSFTAGILTDPTSASIVRAITGLAHEMELECVVEGIENQGQLGALPPGVHGQGFLLGRPMSASDIDALLTQRRGQLSPV